MGSKKFGGFLPQPLLDDCIFLSEYGTVGTLVSGLVDVSPQITKASDVHTANTFVIRRIKQRKKYMRGRVLDMTCEAISQSRGLVPQFCFLLRTIQL